MQVASRIFSDLDGVLRHRVHADRGIDLLPGLGEGLAGAWLVPFHHHEVLLPGTGNEWTAGRARAAVEHQEHGVGAVLTADGDPLIQAADLDEPGLVDPIGSPDRGDLSGLVLPPSAVAEACADRHRQQDHKAQQALQKDVSHNHPQGFSICILSVRTNSMKSAVE